MQNYDPQEKENKWGEPFNHLCILPEDMCQTRECKVGREISRQSMVVLSELRKVGSKSREPAIAGNWEQVRERRELSRKRAVEMCRAAL